MNSNEFIEKMRAKLQEEKKGRVDDKELAAELGIHPGTLDNWRNNEKLSVSKVVSMFFKARKAQEEAQENVLKAAICPIVEFFDLLSVDPKNEVMTKIFEANGNQYLKELQKELEAYHGIYIFYDSSGRALYIGKTEDRKLWQRINETYRYRTVQLRLVDHPDPKRNQKYKTLEEKDRQIKNRFIHLYELASYFSAYKVAKPLIHNTEALLIRSFANDLYNMKMEKMKFF